MISKNPLELLLVNGKRVLIDKNWEKVYNIHEKQYYKINFSKHFPFISIVKKPCTVFKFRTQYQYMDSILDPTYKVDCTLVQLGSLFEVNVIPFEQSRIEKDLN